MKKIIKLLSVLLFLLQVNLSAQNINNSEDRQKYEFEKSKTYSKSYTVSISDKLEIHNKFGAVNIHTWNKNEIKVDVIIKTAAENTDWASSVLNDIQIEDNRIGNVVSFTTLFVEDLDKKEGNRNGGKRTKKYEGKNSKQTMEVNYTVYMPETNPLSINNQFGSINVPDFRGELEAESKFGSLNTGVVPNIKKAVVEFGKASFESIANCSVSIKFSRSEFKKISGNMKLNFEFCDVAKVNFDNSLNSLQVSSSYSTVNLHPINDLSATYTVSTSYGSFVNRTALKFDDDDKENDQSPRFDFKYAGKSGSGTVQIKASTSYGKIILGEPAPEDMRDKESNKSKTKTTT